MLTRISCACGKHGCAKTTAECRAYCTAH